MTKRITTIPQKSILEFAYLPIQQERIGQVQMIEHIGGVGESDFLSYAVGYATGAGAATLLYTGHPVAAGAVAIAGGVYGIATAIDPTLNDRVAGVAESVANTVVSAADSVGDMVSEWWDSGPNTSLSLGNGYY